MLPRVRQPRSEGFYESSDPMSWLRIKYRDFYDVPRAIVVRYRGAVYFFDCPFDDKADEYPDEYTVYRLPSELEPTLGRISWVDLALAGEEIGRVSVNAVQLDPTRRRLMLDEVLRPLSGQPGTGSPRRTD